AIAALAGVLSALAGGNDRADAGQAGRTRSWVLVAVVVLAAVLCTGAFGLPIMRAPDYVAAGLWSNLRVGSVGLLIALLAVLVAVALAPASRPLKAAGLLAGSAGVVGVRVLELPLTSGRVTGATAGPGLWLGLAA